MCRLVSLFSLLVTFASLAVVNPLDFNGVDNCAERPMSVGETLTFDAQKDNVDFQIFEFGVAPQRKGCGDWCVTLTSDTDTVSVRLVEFPNIQDTLNDSGKVRLTLTGRNGAERNVDFNRGIDVESGANYMRINVLTDSVYIYVGGPKTSYAAGMKFRGFYDRAAVIALKPAKLMRSVIAARPVGEYPASRYSTEEEISLQLETATDKSVALWQFLDEDVYTDRAVKACKYTLALLPDRDSGYQLVYISGDTRTDAPWTTGMLKGRLLPTVIPGHYNLEWIDYHGHLMTEGLNATLDGDILTLDFPYDRARLRFIRLPK